MNLSIFIWYFVHNRKSTEKPTIRLWPSSLEHHWDIQVGWLCSDCVYPNWLWIENECNFGVRGIFSRGCLPVGCIRQGSNPGPSGRDQPCCCCFSKPCSALKYVRRRRRGQETKTTSARRRVLERGRLAGPILQHHKHSPEDDKFRKRDNAKRLGFPSGSLWKRFLLCFVLEISSMTITSSGTWETFMLIYVLSHLNNYN